MPRRREYYGDRPPSAPAAGSPRKITRVTGARAIAALLPINEKQVYGLIYKTKRGPDPIPVSHIPKVGLSGDQETLLRWWARQLGVTVA